MILSGIVRESVHRSPNSVVAVLFPPAQQMAKRSHPLTDEARQKSSRAGCSAA